MRTLLLFGIFFKVLFFKSLCSSPACEECDVIRLPQGKVQGNFNILGSYWSYLGIPYASFRGRFKEAGDPSPLNGTFKANRGTVYCKQYSTDTNSFVGDEDCFALNVYTPISPSNSKSRPLAVIFFIPGGGFYKVTNSDSVYNPRYLVQKDVVVVTINYRVGAFGFLCLKNKGAPGNMGLKDQVAALKWVKRNIAYFGGNPESVTISGQSVGAASVNYLISSPTTRGLFQRVIMDSGTPVTPQAYDQQPILTASRAAFQLGYNTRDTDELLQIFLNSTEDDIAKISFKNNTNDPLALYIFKPCTEDPNVSENAILTTSPKELIDSDKYNIPNIDIIMGYNSKEGIMWASAYDSKGLEELNTNFSTAIPNSFTFRKPEDRAALIADIREFYFNNCSTNYKNLIDYFSDVLVMYPSVITMEAFLMNPNIRMYNYYFSYDSLRNLRKLMSKLRNVVRGATHTDELFYIFDPIEYRHKPQIPKDLIMIDRLTNFWANFARTGKPFSDTDIVSWPRSENKLIYLKIDNKIEVVDQPNPKRIDFWKRAYAKYALMPE